MATKKKTPVTVEHNMEHEGRIADLATGTYIEVPRLHPADKMLIERAMHQLKDSMTPEDYEKLVMDVGKRVSMDNLARSASTMALVDKDIRERYGNIEGNVTGLLRAILSELIMVRLNLR